MEGIGMSETSEMWAMIHDMRDRLARQEERSQNRDENIAHISKKLDTLVDMAAQAEGAGKAAVLFGKWGYGIAGVIGATIIGNWQALKKAFFG